VLREKGIDTGSRMAEILAVVSDILSGAVSLANREGMQEEISRLKSLIGGLSGKLAFLLLISTAEAKVKPVRPLEGRRMGKPPVPESPQKKKRQPDNGVIAEVSKTGPYADICRITKRTRKLMPQHDMKDIRERVKGILSLRNLFCRCGIRRSGSRSNTESL